MNHETLKLTSTAQQSLGTSQHKEANKKKLLDSPNRALLSSWIMKPLVSTPGLKEGNVNEWRVLKALPSFFGFHVVMDGSSFYSENSDFHDQKYNIEYIRTTGLISSSRDAMIPYSPDAVLCFTACDRAQNVSAVEIKTITSSNTVDASEQQNTTMPQYLTSEMLFRMML